MQTLNIAHLTFMEARQRRLLWAVALLGFAFLALFAVGFFLVHREFTRQAASNLSELFEVTDFFLLAGLYVVNFLMIMLAVLTSVDTIAGEISSGTIHTIVTKPLRRWEVVLGKWLGLAGMLTVFTIVMSAGMMLIVWLIAGYRPPSPVQGIALMVVEGWVLLTLSILGGTRLSTLTNGVVVFMLYGLAFIAGWIEQIGAVVRNEAAVNIGIVASLLMPSEAMWKRAAYLMEPPFLRALGIHPFSSVSTPSTAMVAYTIAYILLGLSAAIYSFQQRDL
ncbi:MAG: ABC transporter permease [Chloroflexi bacterium]|nr:MAG: ABC transporter permease [Chloroflexota bacterium]